ncbi:hypothetical protein MTX26_00915 [Bradyrhizobium sp. ISRA443]|uniref:hypothetical protein n=1 Tax=unclassified Bradyrhizobium TaxID=2631580 RepID=UPI002479F00F|nr:MULTISPECIES: hypothetical protein [unclassified Bradyrhizobium]WGR94667.1 hypothetical protein MTX20_10920 [Bradyrhizobium sp. ISRA435]WGR99466.1 hypothetical protein MTX23_00915 [Bradyrhizobium sp. ISRA436]WGS06357.1 hypothetical protein MTX18_00915 [Bradyrhizobium sp. ISRA437]WGS13241.1 hypothetical protein MTX26_00915 [Bradyrhizobium sp. ISRA443]
MNLPAWKNPWRVMLAVNAAVLVGLFFYKITLRPFVPYIHLLVDYHYGFTKRALIGAIVSLFTDKVPVWLVFALGGAIWLVTLGLFVKLFRRTFGLDDAHWPLFVFTAGSPFFLKNFMFSLGHFDIYGCALAIVLLLIPARSIAYVLVAALFSIVLILIHHIFVLMYVPTIAAIVVLRFYLVQGVTSRSAVAGIAALAAVGILFLAAQFLGTVDVPYDEFLRHLQSRMADPSRTDLLEFGYIWYQPLSKEITDTWARMPSNILGVPVFALLIWLHTPLWRHFARLIDALASELHRRIVIAAIIMIGAGFSIMFVIVFDYSRWISNWAVCMILMLHAVKMLPASKEVPVIPSDDRRTTTFGWILTLIPRVGIIRPF